MSRLGNKPGTMLTCKSGTFMCYNYGQKVWKFHGERSGDKMPGEEEFSRPSMVIKDGTIRLKQTLGTVDLDTRKLGRSTSTGSSSSSESECSSQPSPISETTEDVADDFLLPMTPDGDDCCVVESQDQEITKLPCSPPSPVEIKNKVDIKALSNLINSLLKKHSLVQSGLELLKQKPALALRLQQRRTRKVLADQGIIPPLKSPGAYYEQRQKLERARTGDFLNKKMQDRPDRDHLVQKHILEDTNAYDSLVAHQKELKKAQLVDDLNEKIFHRPGVFELVEKNILPADETVAEALKGGHVQYKKTRDFVDEDSSDAFSPEMPSSHDQGASYGSPPSFSSSPLPAPAVTSTAWAGQASMAGPVSKQDSTMVTASSSNKMARSVSSTHTTAGHPYLMRQSSSTKSSKVSPSVLSQRNLRKKKEKPKFKKFKYHQYIPPDQQGKSTEPAMPDLDTPYSRLLEQQQLYLQLQIMNQQYPSLMHSQKSPNGSQMQDVKNFSVPPAPPAPPNMSLPKPEKKKRSFTVQQLEEMKVAELKEELKARKEKVTGTKEVLVERLRRFAVPNPKPPPSSQPISESITGLINATIQSTIRANTEQALAAAVNNNSASGAILLKPRTPPTQTKQDSQQANKSNTMPSTANLSVPGQRVIAPAPDLQFKVDTSAKSFEYSEFEKDDLLHKQQQEIEDLKRMVELHRTQLHQIQEKERSKQQEVSNANNNTSNMILNQPEQTEQGTMNMVEQTMKRQHISQVLQKHLQSKLNSKEAPMMINGLNQRMPLVKQEIPVQVEENVFSFSAMPPNVSLVPLQSGDNSATVQEDAPIILSIKPPVERSLSESKEPPKYDQAIQMLNEEKRRLSHHSFGSQENMAESPANPSNLANEDMDDLLELLENKGEIPVTPTRQKAFPQTGVIEGRIPQHATMHYPRYSPSHQQQQQMHAGGVIAHRRSVDQLQRAISANELDNMTQQSHRHSLELSALMHLSDTGLKRKDPNIHRRHSGDILDSNTQRRYSGDLLSYHENHTGLTPLLPENQSDFTTLLVSSAGDILMDASHMPPSNLQGRLNLQSCISPEAVTLHQEPVPSGGNQMHQDDPSKSNAYLNLSDPYATQPFSPMDTGSSDAHSRNGMMEERVRDPHLSSSSIHDSRQSLDKCLDAVSLPQSTGSYLRRYEQPLADASPQRHPHSHLIKSSSQELLSGHVPGLDHSMQVDELGWLDLTLSSPHHAPPSPMNLQQQHRTSMHSSMGSVLDHESGGNPYNLSGDSLGTSNNEFDLIDSLDLNSIGNAGIDSWEGI